MNTEKICNEDTSSDTYRISLDRAWALSELWKRTAIIWRTLDHVFAIGAFSLSMLVVFISATNAGGSVPVIALSALSGILSLVGFVCNPTKYMRGYRIAYQILNEALVINTDEYGKARNGEESYRKIRKAISIAERYIGTTYEVGKSDKEENSLEDDKNDGES